VIKKRNALAQIAEEILTLRGKLCCRININLWRKDRLERKAGLSFKKKLKLKEIQK
jgi:hypothetical protein